MCFKYEGFFIYFFVGIIIKILIKGYVICQNTKKNEYDVIDNHASSVDTSYWSILGFPIKLNTKADDFQAFFYCTDIE